jgi:hypothetical protein
LANWREHESRLYPGALRCSRPAGDTHPNTSTSLAPTILLALDAMTVRISGVTFLVQRFADRMSQTLDFVLNH